MWIFENVDFGNWILIFENFPDYSFQRKNNKTSNEKSLDYDLLVFYETPDYFLLFFRKQRLCEKNFGEKMRLLGRNVGQKIRYYAVFLAAYAGSVRAKI